MKPLHTSTITLRSARVGIIAGLAIMILFLGTAPALAARLNEIAYTGCGGADAPIIDDAYEARVVELVNEQRAANGNLPPVKRIVALGKSARYHATDLGTDNYFNHDTYDRSGGIFKKVCGAFDRMRAWYNWTAAGENIAAGYGTPEEVMAGWMKSDGHRRNILDPNFTEIGVGYYKGSGDYGVYWVQNLGARAGEYPMIINNDSPDTADRNVAIYVHGAWNEMRLRNDSGAWGEWQPFSSSFTWTINDGVGEHMISAELRSGSDTHSSCDKINLTTATAVAAPASADYQLFLPLLESDGQQEQALVVCD
ncbi:MAG: hypothetical protein IPM07_02290 [Anaerolineales bacterium]|nr:hypothetical protein [Anaerolineales bacterium]